MANSSNKGEQPTLSSPTDTEVEVLERILNTLVGIVDTPEELDAQRRNLGPKDTNIEADSLNDEPDLNDDEPDLNGPQLG